MMLIMFWFADSYKRMLITLLDENNNHQCVALIALRIAMLTY